MPELPEVETTLRGIAPHVTGHTVTTVIARTPKLRLPISPGLATALPGQTVEQVERRAKYLLLRCNRGSAILHLGMTGTLRIVPADTSPGKHDHLDFILDNSATLRFRDPRKFGLALWTNGDPLLHPLLVNLGPEPLAEEFDGPYLHRVGRNRRVAIKQLLMDNRIVVGIGNIYANEALFRARIRPDRPAGSLSEADALRLATCVKEVLRDAIAEGGTTLRDFTVAEEPSGYFSIHLAVYGRGGEPCPACGAPIEQSRLGNRSTWFCAHCQR